MNTVVVPSSLIDGFIRFIETSSLTVKSAGDEISIHRQGREKAAALLAPLLDHMVAVGVIPKSQKAAAAAMLGDYAGALQMCKAAVDKIAELTAGQKPAVENGVAVAADRPRAGGTTKSAGEYDSLSDPFIGRRTSFVKESDRKLRPAIGR